MAIKAILVLTRRTLSPEQSIPQFLQQLYPRSQLTFRAFTKELLTELATTTLPRLILIDEGTDCVSIMNQLRLHPRLARTPILLLRAEATQRKVWIESGETKWLNQSVRCLPRHRLN